MSLPGNGKRERYARFSVSSPAISQQGGRGNGLAHSDVAKMKRRIEEHAANGGGDGGTRLWQARWQAVFGDSSVSVPPPNRAKLHCQVDSLLDFRTAPITVVEEKTTYEDVLVDGKTIKVTITKESSVVQDWIEQQTGPCFGLDLEWKPNRRKGQPENKVALMQISSETECVLIQMLFLDSIPSALVQFLKDPKRKIVGVGISEDVRKLRRDFGLICAGEVDLAPLAVAHLKMAGPNRPGLKVLAMRVLGFHMDKSKSVTMSDWATSHLDGEQIKYACIDAWVSYAIFSRLQTSRRTYM